MLWSVNATNCDMEEVNSGYRHNIAIILEVEGSRERSRYHVDPNACTSLSRDDEL